eukprot:gnl/TRDRNA2_/TRDRNA2_127174_c0_seq1.p3 gnl/TRDRNA2_/TRDRNA2_127174_c0~~gnl/TRDRNA2_/TRDRNA2_127174_c0_seq1.p3  ORF type:complete len:110 (+),score=23.61 gnl/TRDRNA2_/TRDRNA2_127174_c0_seq1:362-691(+)
MWAVTKVQQWQEKLFAKFAVAAKRRSTDFTAQELANTTWAFAKATQWDENLLTVLVGEAERRISEFNEQELSNVAWAFARAHSLNVKQFTAFARATDRIASGNIRRGQY